MGRAQPSRAPARRRATPLYRRGYSGHDGCNRIPHHDLKAQLGAIFSAARSNNKKAGVTGALLTSDDWFVQTLEGAESAVRELYEHICRDPRHERVLLVDERSTEGRTFGRWAMAKVGEDGEPDIPLINNRDRGGAVQAAGRQTTPEQEAVLELMRDSIRESSQPA